MAQLEEFLPLVRQQINGPIDFMMTDAVLQAAIVFCRESTIVRSVVNLEGVVADQPYTLTDPTGQLRAFRRLSVYDKSSSDRRCDWDWLEAGCQYDVIDSNTITFRSNMNKAIMHLALCPTNKATEVPDVLLNEYQEAIAYGALERLFIMPGKPWTDEQRSAYYKARFTDGFRDALREVLESTHDTGFHNAVRRRDYY